MEEVEVLEECSRLWNSVGKGPEEVTAWCSELHRAAVRGGAREWGQPIFYDGGVC